MGSLLSNLNIACENATVVMLKRRLLTEIRIAVDIIQELDDVTFRQSSNNSASVGEQFRHNLDFLNLFLDGVELGKVDYSNRERDVRVQCSRRYAIVRFGIAASRIAKLPRYILAEPIAVRSEIDRCMWFQSSVGREMEFVLSHTIHHHALIAEKLSRSGIELERAIGLAPSTEEYLARLAA